MHVTICDRCGKEAQLYRVTIPYWNRSLGRVFHMELCENCVKDIYEYAQMSPKVCTCQAGTGNHASWCNLERRKYE